jgi:uncharacterized membrane protein
MPKKTKKLKEEIEEKTIVEQKVDPVLIRDEEKAAVSVGLVFGIAYLLVGALISVAPATTAMLLRALTFGVVEINNATQPDSSILLIGLVTAVMMGVVGGFFYAKIYNIIKKS